MQRPETAIDKFFFMGILNPMRTGRPPLKEADRRTEDIKIPLTASEKKMIQSAAQLAEEKHVPWARAILVAAAERKLRKANGG